MAELGLLFEKKKGDLQANGIFKRGAPLCRDQNPLIVLIHGTGTNAAYFENDFHSIPTDFNDAGYDVLSINRPGYGGNPIPESFEPMQESIPVIADLISMVYKENLNGKHGIVLIGHSLGAAIALGIAALESKRLPILGVSALGVIPTTYTSAILQAQLIRDPNSRCVVIDPTLQIETYFGPPSTFEQSILDHPSMGSIFEPALKSELLEWFSSAFYDRFTSSIAPGVQIPLQFLAAEYELGWKGINEGQPIFAKAMGFFTNAPIFDAKILKGGGHNYEFSMNASVLRELRMMFVKSLKLSQTSSTSISQDPADFHRIPLLDYSLARDQGTKQEFLQSLRNAIINVGFFYIKNTTVPTEIQEDLVEKGIKLFNLPLDEKLKIEMVNSKHFLGYVRLGTEITAMKQDHREQADFATEVPAPGPDEPLYSNLRGPNQWPDDSVIPGFRAAVESYMSEINTLAKSFHRLIAEALGMPAAAFDKFFDNPQHNKLKLVKYPPPPMTELIPEEGIQGVGPHKDGSFLTFLLQATPHKGLEIQNKNGEWIEAPPIPGTLVINIGRALQALTGGVCTATTHRVVLSHVKFVDDDGKYLGPRYSFPVFEGVKTDLQKGQIDLPIPQHIKDLVKDEKIKSEAEATFDKMFGESVREANFISRITSHQDVGRRWYPDLLEKALEEQKRFQRGD